MDKILVCVDSSEYSKKVAEKANDIARKFNSDIIIIHVIESHIYYTSTQLIPYKENYIKVMKERANNLLNKYKEYFKGLEGKVNTYLLEGNPSHEIIRFIKENEVDLVIMGANGVSGFSSFLGSTANKLLHHIDKPILIIK